MKRLHGKRRRNGKHLLIAVDPIDLLIENSKGRVEELLPIRYGRMMVSPFTFYRGAAAIMAYDLSHTPSYWSDPDCRWRLPPVELRRLCHSRTKAHL